MATRITRADLETALESAKSAASKLGIVSTNWHLQIGSKTYGNAYRLFNRNPESGGLYNVHGINDYLGMTASEAYGKLCAMTDAWYAVLAAADIRYSNGTTDYEVRQIASVLDKNTDGHFLMKIIQEDNNASTKWLSVTTEQVRRIQTAL